MIADAGKIRKFRAQNRRDQAVPGGRVVFVIEIPLVQDQIRALRPDQFQNGPGAGARTLITDEGGGQVIGIIHHCRCHGVRGVNLGAGAEGGQNHDPDQVFRLTQILYSTSPFLQWHDTDTA